MGRTPRYVITQSYTSYVCLSRTHMKHVHFTFPPRNSGLTQTRWHQRPFSPPSPHARCSSNFLRKELVHSAILKGKEAFPLSHHIYYV